MPHHCHARECLLEVPPKLLMCPKHWRQVPPVFQRAVWATYRAGQERTKDPSARYLLAAECAIYAVAVREGAVPAAEAIALLANLAEALGLADVHATWLAPHLARELPSLKPALPSAQLRLFP